MIEEVKDIQKKYCSQALVFAIIIAVLAIFIDEKAIGKGFLLGTLFSITNFIIMGQLIPLRLSRSRSKASILAFFSIILRFLIITVPLIVSLKTDSIHFIGVVVGLFMVQLTMLFDHLISNRFPFKRKE